MKSIVVVLSGAADIATEELGGKTPFEVAKIPTLHEMTRLGKLGQVNLAAGRRGVHADASLLGLLGYNAKDVYSGRAPLEAANQELSLEENEVPFRMNFVTEYDGVLSDPTAGEISPKEAAALLNFLNKKLSSGFVRFFQGSGYRHLAVIKDSHGYEALSAKTFSPRQICDKEVAGYMPQGPGAELIKKLMYDAKLLLQDHEVNQVRSDLGENPANMIWLWGQGQKTELDSFNQKFDVKSAMISRSEYAKGIARLAGLTVLEVGEPACRPGRREVELTECYERASRVMLDALTEKDFICVHLADCDEASWNGDLRSKITALEAADYYLLAKLKKYVDKHPDTRVLLTPAYALSWKEKQLKSGSVPVALYGAGIGVDDAATFTEMAAKTSELKFNAPELMPNFLGE